MHNIDITILGEQALAALMQRLSEARGKHPVFAEGKYHALGVIGEEYRELYTPLSTKLRSVSATKPSM